MFVKLAPANLFKYLFATLVATLPLLVHAQSDDVNFGTIFIENLEYDNSDERHFINHLTDKSDKQKELETLYPEVKKHNTDLRKIDMREKRKPASATNKIGIIKNDEIEQKIDYFLELRTFRGNQPVSIYSLANRGADPIHVLQPGQIIKVTDNPHEYLHKLRMDRDNQGLWKQISNRAEDNQSMHIYYDWRNFNTITPHEFPMEVDIVVPRNMNSVPVFSRPGPWTWRDCGLGTGLCVDNLDIHAKAYLFDATIVSMSQIRQHPDNYHLFYKIGYVTKTKDGEVRHKVGWISSEYAKRKISQLPKTLLATRGPAGIGYESDAERMARLKKFYVFDANMDSNNKRFSRWLASTPGSSNELFLQNVAFDGVINGHMFHMEQSFLDGEFDQQGINVGIGIYAPIYIDLEVQGTFSVVVPFAAEFSGSENFDPAFMFKGDQWLLYTSPLNVGSLPFKFGVGGYYMTMFTSQRGDFGFNSLVGFQGKVMLDGEEFWTSLRYGPTGQDLSFDFKNRDLGFEFGYRLNPEKGYKSWSIFAEFSDTNYTSPTTDTRTTFQIFQAGLRKQF